MTYWKQGCRWYSGAPSFYEDVCKKHGVILCADHHMKKGDIVAVTIGFSVLAIAKVTGDRIPLRNCPDDMRTDFHNKKVPDNISLNNNETRDNCVVNAEIYELPANLKFEYQLQTGICQIQKSEIINKIDNAMNEIHKVESLNTLLGLAKEKKNVILQGAPGTGKTYSTSQLALGVIGGYDKIILDHEKVMEEFKTLRKQGQIEFVTFHMSMDYEDFIEGIKVSTNGKGDLCYIPQDGIFKIISKAAEANPDKNYVLIIDEINRGNISKIFGELITLLETDKRFGEVNGLTVKLPYSKEDFSVPKNLYIIGTMNTTDRSVGSLDYALRRRFSFYTIESQREVIEIFYSFSPELGKIALEKFDAVKKFLKDCQSDIDIRDLMVGHSYFMASGKKELDRKWTYEILPLLDEYYKDGIINKKWSEDR